MSDSQFMLRSSLINLAGLALRIALSPLMLFLPRFFAQDLFGLFVVLRSLVGACQEALGPALGQGLAWRLPQRGQGREFRNGAVWGVVLLALLAGLAVAALLLAAFLAFRGMLPSALRDAPGGFVGICLASLPGLLVLHAACGAMDGIRRPAYRAFLVQSLAVGLVPVLALGFFLLGVPDALAWSLFGAGWCCAMIVAWRLRREFPLGAEAIVVVPERGLLSYVAHLSLGNGAQALLRGLDLWLVGLLLGRSEAAVYGVMLMLASGVLVAWRSYEPMIVPVVSGASLPGRGGSLPTVLAHAQHLIASAQLAVAVFLVCFQRELLAISGPQYAAYPRVFVMLVVASLAAGFHGVAAQVLLGLGRSATVLKVRLAMLGLAVVLGMALVPRHGLAGAAGMALVVGVAHAATLLVLQSRILGRWPDGGRGFCVNVALLAGFALAAALSAPFLAQAGLAFRAGLFMVLAVGLGVPAYLARRSFVPPA